MSNAQWNNGLHKGISDTMEKYIPKICALTKEVSLAKQNNIILGVVGLVGCGLAGVIGYYASSFNKKDND